MSGYHIKFHDFMVDYVLLQLRKQLGTYVRAVSKIEKTPGTKPDIEVLTKMTGSAEFETRFIDVTFTSPNNFKNAYNSKITKHKLLFPTITPLVFGKNCTMYSETKKRLQELRVDIPQIERVLGILVARHYSVCHG